MKPGDLVAVVMTRNNVFPWQNAPSFAAVYQYGPSGPGDVFIVSVPGHTKELALNGNSLDFVGMYKNEATT